MANDEKHFDALVVGAGMIGLACAWRLAQAGLTVRVLERDRPGSGASNVAAGMLAPVGEATWGEDRFLALAIRSHELWPQFARELGDAAEREVGFLALGALHAAFDRDEAAELRRRYDLMRSLELDAEWMRTSRCRRLEPGLGTGVAGGVLAPHEAAVDPRRLVGTLERAAARAGAEIVPGVEVAQIEIAGDGVGDVVAADGSRHRAPTVVLAAGSWSGQGLLPEPLAPPVRPVKGQIVTLAGDPAAPVCERIVVSERVYIVPRADGRLVVGATVEEMGFDTRITAGGVHELLREAYRTLPEIAELELVETLAGLRPGSPDNAPLIGAAAVEGLIFATGHFRNGLLLTPITAEAVTALATGGDPPAELSAADPSRFVEAETGIGA